MTEEELIKNGYRAEACRVGTLYFKYPFFARFITDDAVAYFSESDDLHPIGYATNISDIRKLEKGYYIDQREKLEKKLTLLDKIIASYE